MNDNDAFLGALALFRAMEHDPPDESHTRLAAALIDEWGAESLVAGLVLVSAVLRCELLRHAARCGCDCGSSLWLERMTYHHNAAPS